MRTNYMQMYELTRAGQSVETKHKKKKRIVNGEIIITMSTGNEICYFFQRHFGD